MTVIVKGVAALRDLPKEVKRATVMTNGTAKAPDGWKEAPGGMHIGKGRWVLAFERDEQ